MTQTPDAPAPDTISGWAIVELMGHRRLAGLVTETLLAGVPFLRIDIPSQAGPSLTQYYPPGSLYCLTPCSEAAARAVAKSNQPEPVHYFELPGPRVRAPRDDDEDPEAF